ncbi:MAG: metallophosphoesterase family protein [Candidatus Eisenbacteria bacterium]|nr:metallophosphoesterase family protein [Candidatus Eisenbacteria bacterium]
MKTTAVLADVHGNRWALEAVLADAARRGVFRFVNLGDSLYGPLDPEGTADLLLSLDAPTVRGNEDRIVTERRPGAASSPTLDFTRSVLGPAHLAWLESLPPAAVAFDAFFLCHGTPARDDAYLLREVSAAGVRLRRPEEIDALLGGGESPVVLCAHDHLPGIVPLPNGRLVVNPGSVGCPAFEDDHPYPHVMEAGSPEARYAILERDGGEWAARAVSVPYDREAAARAAERNGRPDWARWIRTGRARG